MMKKVIISLFLAIATGAFAQVAPSLESDNRQIVQAFNDGNLTYNGTDTKKKRGALAYVLGLKEGSILETSEVKATLAMKVWYGRVHRIGTKVDGECILDLGEPSGYNQMLCNRQYRLAVMLTNKTDAPLYVDISNCHIMQKGISTPYSVSAEAAGTGQERIAVIPPRQTIALTPQDIGEGFTWITNRKGAYHHQIIKAYLPYFLENGYAVSKGKNYTEMFSELRRGEKIDIPQQEGISPLGTTITYSLSRDMNTTQMLHMDFYLRQVVGCKDTKATNIDFSQCPLIFFSSGALMDFLQT